MKSLKLVSAVLALPWFASCVIDFDGPSRWTADYVGSGVSATETRSVGEFDTIEVRSAIDLDVEVGPARSVVLEADDNVLPRLLTEVRDGALVITTMEGSYHTKVQPRATIQVPALGGLRISGSSDARLSGLSGGSLVVAISGSGDVRASGSVDALEIKISGSGDVAMRELVAKRAEVAISGSGDVDVHATEALRVRISGSGDVRYVGGAKVETSVSGSGDVERAD